jgi:hypothetical protein
LQVENRFFSNQKTALFKLKTASSQVENWFFPNRELTLLKSKITSSPSFLDRKKAQQKAFSLSNPFFLVKRLASFPFNSAPQ